MFVFFWIYTYHYPDRKTSDMYRYFDDAQVMLEAMEEKPGTFFKMLTGLHRRDDSACMRYYMKMDNWYRSYDYFFFNDNRMMIRLNAAIGLLSGGSIHIHGLFFMILGYIGTIFLARTFPVMSMPKNQMLTLLLFFFPSLVFWTSHISKEAFAIFVVGGFLYSGKMSVQHKRVVYFLTMLIFLVLLTTIKPYIFLILIMLLPGIIASLVPVRVPVGFRFAFSTIIVIITILLIDAHITRMNLLENFARRQHDFIHFARSVDAGSLMNTPFLEPTVWSFIKNLPQAFVNVLFRPFFVDAHNVFMFFLSFESLFILMFILFTIFHRMHIEHQVMFWLSFWFSMIFCAIIGLSTPVLGALVRYKVIVFPFVFYMLIEFLNERKIIDKVHKMNRIWKK